MIDSFRLMYPGDISMDIAGDTDKLQDLLFTSTKINDSFINMINKLSANFVKRSKFFEYYPCRNSCNCGK